MRQLLARTRIRLPISLLALLAPQTCYLHRLLRELALFLWTTRTNQALATLTIAIATATIRSPLQWTLARIRNTNQLDTQRCCTMNRLKSNPCKVREIMPFG